MYPNHLKYILWTLSRRIRPNILILAFCGPEIKVRRDSEVPECTEIIMTAARDIEYTIKMDPSHLKYILWTVNGRF